MFTSLFTSRGRRPLVMGVVNVTPDSFYADSRVLDRAAALERARAMVAAGADLLDVGGESTRPGSSAVEETAEQERVVPVISALRAVLDVPISIDTKKASVASAALDAGADMVNDVSGLTADPEMAPLVAGRNVPVCIMHMQGDPATMQKDPRYSDPVADIVQELRRLCDAALELGVKSENIIVDPGIGFGKTVRDNLAILARLEEFRSLGYPILVGISRKSFVGKVLAYGGGPSSAGVDAGAQADAGADVDADHARRFEAIDRVSPRPAEQRLAGSLGAGAMAVLAGADFLRVHDVAETADLVTVMGAVAQEARHPR